jgi:hypothetical protein
MRTGTDQNKHHESPDSYPQCRAPDVPESPCEEPLDEQNGKKAGGNFTACDQAGYTFK